MPGNVAVTVYGAGLQAYRWCAGPFATTAKVGVV